MGILAFCFAFIAIFDNSFFKLKIGPVAVMYVVMAATAVYYLWAIYTFTKRRKRLDRGASIILGLCFFGVLMAAISFTGILSGPIGNEVFVDYSYIPRQAYYLYFFPLIAVAPLLWTPGKGYQFFRRHAILCGFFLYVCKVLVGGSFALSVPITLALGACLLAPLGKRTLSHYALLLVLVFSPIATGGEFTQIIIRAIAVGYFIAGAMKEKVGRACWIALLCVVCGSLAAGLVLAYVPLDLDANSAWRLNYWADEMSLLVKTYGLGSGYGTSYASLDFLYSNGFGAAGGPFAATAEYTPLERAFLTGCHNSFISLAYRLGVIGIVLLMLFLADTQKNMNRDGSCPLFVRHLFFASLFIIAFNVGLESPGYCFCFLIGAALPRVNWGKARPALANQADSADVVALGERQGR